MAMQWRVTAGDYQPGMVKQVDRQEARKQDVREGRRRLSAWELNAIICTRAAWLLVNNAVPSLERQAKHTGKNTWGRLRACTAQIGNLIADLLDKTSVEQLLSIKNNTQNVKLNMIPHKLPSDPDCIVMQTKDQERLLCASLAYCQFHCKGDELCQRNCSLKPLLDDSLYIETCEIPDLIPGTCKYNMCDVDWAGIRGDKTNEVEVK